MYGTQKAILSEQTQAQESKCMLILICGPYSQISDFCMYNVPFLEARKLERDHREQSDSWEDGIVEYGQYESREVEY